MIPSWPWWIWAIIGLVGLLFIILEGAYRLVSQKDDERKEMEERAIKAEEKLTTKIILTLLDCYLSVDNYLYIKLSLCNDGYKTFTIEIVNIITAGRNNLLKIQDYTGSLDNSYNNILKIDCIQEISKQPVPERSITYNPGETDEMEIKELFNLKEFINKNNLDNIKKMPLGIIMRVRDYRGSQHFVNYYPCCELYIGEDGKIRTYIIHKPFEKILKEGETNIIKSWRV